jgi:signal peptidase I
VKGDCPSEAIPPRHPAPVRALLVWVRDLAISVLLAAVLVVFVYQPVKVEGSSMAPALEDQERVFVSKLAYKFGDIRRGDAVVFRYPPEPSKSYIKRVIGIPGDRIRIDAGQVYVNGRALAEDYVMDRGAGSWPSPPEAPGERLVPPGQYFVLGDNRAFSSDSRSWGFVPRENIYGKAVFAYWPPDRVGLLRQFTF